MKKAVSWASGVTLAASVIGAVVTLGAGSAEAARWQVTELGATRPFYAEHRFGVNANGRAAWTALVSGAPRARGYTGSASVDLHALLPGGAFLSYGQDTAGHSHVVGYSATSTRESERRAVLWRWTGASWTSVLDLHAAAVAAAGAPQQQTAAYAVSDVTGGGEIYVAGFRREQVGGGGTYSVPLVWATDALTSAVNQVRELELGDFDYGVAYGVTEDGVVIGGVGYATGGTTYMVSAWWELSVDANGDGRPDLNLVPGMQVADGWSTSVANRVRRLTINGDVGSYAVGTGFDSGGVLHAFVHRVGPGGWTDADGFVLPGGANALAFDVTVGEIAGQQGIQVVGASNNVSGVLPAQPNTAHGTDGAQLLDVGPEAQVCSVLDSLPASAPNIDMLNGAFTDSRRVGWGGSNAYLLTRLPYNEALRASLIVRDTPAQPGQAARDQFRVTAPSTSTNTSLLWSQSAGCAAASGCPGASLDLAENAGDVRVTLDTIVSGNRAYSAVISGGVPTTGFVQTSSEAGSCSLGPVEAITSMSRVLNPPGTTWNGVPLDGNWCDFQPGVPGAETNILENLTRCGTTCANAVSAVDGFTCTADLCTDGLPSNPVHAGSCLLPDPSQPGSPQACFADGALQPVNAGAEPASTRNFCQRCDSATAASRTVWSNTAATCCTGGQPTWDAWGHTGYRQPRPANVPYSGSGTGRTSLPQAGWMRRLNDVTDADLWSTRRSGLTCSTSNSCDTDQNRGPHTMTSYLNGLANQEDWYWFRHLDVNGGGSRNSEPRARLLPAAGVNLDMCVYWRCLNAPGARETSIDTLSPGGTSTLAAVSRNDSPLHDGVRGLNGVCATRASAGPQDVELLVESSGGCGSPGPWDIDVFIRISPASGQTPPTCNQPYTLYWGNDQRRDRNCLGTWGSYGDNTCVDCCDGQNVRLQSGPL